MFKGRLFHVLILYAIISFIKAAFDFKLKYCRFKCDDQCGSLSQDELRNPVTNALNPTAYYWRDYYGVIPSDVYRLGNSNQYPQTYIGMVFNPSKNGSFVTTIIEELDYVYSVLDGEVTKLMSKTEIIQILCTMTPEKLVWIKLTEENIKTIPSYKPVQAGYHVKYSNGKVQYFRHYVTKVSKCSVKYVGSVNYFNETMEYVLMDGTAASTNQLLWLMYKPTSSSDSTMNNVQPFISHHYEYSIRKDSLIPRFYKQLNIGPCSVTCTNEDTGQDSELKKNKMAANAMLYYWTPDTVWNEEEAVYVGTNYIDEIMYLGQSYNKYNWYDIGSTDGKGLKSVYMKSYFSVPIYHHILGTNYPEVFEWVNTTQNTFTSLDKTRLLRGGDMGNGTQIFVGRRQSGGSMEIGSIRVFENYSMCYTQFRAYGDFMVLMFREEQNQ